MLVRENCLRAARLQNELAPAKKKADQCEKCFENAKKDPKNDPERLRKLSKPLSRRLEISHWHLSKSFSPPKICTKKNSFFTARLCRGGHAKRTIYHHRGAEILADPAKAMVGMFFSCVFQDLGVYRRLKFIQYRIGVWKCPISLPPDPSSSI